MILFAHVSGKYLSSPCTHTGDKPAMSTVKEAPIIGRSYTCLKCQKSFQDNSGVPLPLSAFLLSFPHRPSLLSPSTFPIDLSVESLRYDVEPFELCIYQASENICASTERKPSNARGKAAINVSLIIPRFSSTRQAKKS